MIDEEKARLIQFTLDSRGWYEHLKPMGDAEKVAMQATQALTLEERPSPKFSDEFLRGYVRGLDFFLVRPYRLLQERDNARGVEETPPEPASVGDPYSPLNPSR